MLWLADRADEALRHCGHALTVAPEESAALELMRKLLAGTAPPRTPVDPYDVAEYPRMSERLTDAGRVVEGALVESLDDPSLLAEIAAVLTNMKRPAEALPFVEAALAEDPAYRFAHQIRALALSNLERHEDAINAARSGFELGPEDGNLADTLTVTLLRARRMAEAADAARNLISLAPMWAYLRGVMAARRRQPRTAREASWNTLRMDPHYPGARHELAKLNPKRSRRR
jgi:tetratricopeptide (TPR) repeat protein